MMPVIIEGLDKLAKTLDSRPKVEAAKRALRAAALHIKGKIDIYPPSSEANQPRDFNSFYSIKTHRPINTWYERGFGPKWRRKDGSIGGSRTSETLGRKWTIKAENAGFTQVVGNNVSYAPFVHDAEKQAGFHKARGWKTDEQVAREEQKRVVEFVEAEIRKALK